MAGVSLRSYIQDIERMVETERSEEAIAHCRYILQTYPRYIQVYRLLGKAYLENQRYGDAADIFQRVLSSVPDDFVSHVGMSIIREDEGNLDEAIWHMERAFEVQPANSAIQEELRRLFERRDNVAPPKIRLTRGALARMYLKGDLYQQAIAEIRAALSENPDRLDLQALLATCYAKAGQHVEAAEVCSNILRKLPNCLVANQILADILKGTEREAEARACLQRLQSLDPYAAFLSSEHPTIESVPDDAVSLEKLAWKPELIPSGTAEQPVWATSLGIEIEDFAPQREALPSWLSGITPEKPEIPEVKAPPPFIPPTTPAFPPEALEQVGVPPEEPLSEAEVPEAKTSPEELIPDWMREAGWEPSAGVGKESQEAEEEKLAEAEIPDWLRAMAPIPSPEEKKPEAEEDILPWLEQILPSTPEAGAAVQAEEAKAEEELVTGEVGFPEEVSAGAIPAEGEELPEWLSALTPEEEIAPQPTPTFETPIPAEEGEALPEWSLEQEAGPFEPVPPQEALPEEVQPFQEEIGLPETEALPEWLQEVEAMPSEEIQAPGEEAFVPSTEELPEWVLETAQPTAEQPETSEALPDWLFELEEISAPEAEYLEEPVISEAAAVEEPTYLGDTQPTRITHPEAIPPPPEAPVEEVPPIAEEIPVVAEEVGAVPETAEEIPLPAWLQEEIQPTAEATEEEVSAVTEPKLEEPLPAWLAEEIQAQPELTISAEEAQAPEIPEKEITPEVPQPIGEDMDAAFAWLESLAVKQGADEALLLKPEERIETPPEWVLQEAEKEEVIPSAEMAAEEVIPEQPEVTAPSLEMGEEVPLYPTEELLEKVIEEEAVVPPAEEELPEFIPTLAEEEFVELAPKEAIEAEEEQLRILEAEAAKEELLEAQKAEVVEAEQPAEEEGIPELPSWLREAAPEPTELEWAPPIGAPRQLDLNKASLVELERLPGVGFIIAQRIIDYREMNGPFKKVDDLLLVPGLSPFTLEEIRDSLTVEAREIAPAPPAVEEVLFEVEEAPADLADARRALNQGKLEEAVERYTALINAYQYLPNIVEDLEQAASLYPNETSLWQSLGDAYLRLDQTQKALQAYIKAEETLQL